MTADLFLEIGKNLGIAGFCIYSLYRLADKWAEKFLDVQGKQAVAMGDLAAAVREGQGDQREVLLAVRVIATEQRELKGWIKELDGHIRQGAKGASV